MIYQDFKSFILLYQLCVFLLTTIVTCCSCLLFIANLVLPSNIIKKRYYVQMYGSKCTRLSHVHSYRIHFNILLQHIPIHSECTVYSVQCTPKSDTHNNV